ncbi:MAG: hypothetical protein V4526_00800 [Patescibacteria group bacterium]
MRSRRFLGDSAYLRPEPKSFSWIKTGLPDNDRHGGIEMKLKQCITAVAAIFCCLTLTLAASAQVKMGEGDDLSFTSQTVKYDVWKSRAKADAKVVTPPVIYMSNVVLGVRIKSIAATTSPSTLAVRTNVMAGLAGDDVPTDPTTDPAAWVDTQYHGLQWWHYITTPFYSYMGTPTSGSGDFRGSEYGHRLGFHSVGSGSPVDYDLLIESSSSTTSIPTGRYAVVTNSLGQLRSYNRNFVGAHIGADGVYKSFFDRAQNVWVEVGDDSIYTAGEMPTAVPTTHFLDFGATSYRDVSSEAELAASRSMFTNSSPASNHWVKASLIRRPNTVTSSVSSTSSSMPSLAIEKMGGNIKLTVRGGQKGLRAQIQVAAPTVTSPWTLLGNTVFDVGGWTNIPAADTNKFFRLVPAP